MSKQDNPAFVHNGVHIMLLTNGQFAAHVKGVETRASTLAALKKKIDAADTFVPFKVVQWERYGAGKFEFVEIVGTRKNTHRYRAPFVWVDARGRTYDTVTPDTPENRDAMQAARKKRIEIHEIESNLKGELRDLEAKIEHLAVPGVAPK